MSLKREEKAKGRWGLLKPPPALCSKRIVPYLFLSPWIIGFFVFYGGPMIATLFLSLTKWDILTPPKWVGLSNYLFMFKGYNDFWLILKNTIVYTFLAMVVSVTWALITAMLLNKKVPGTNLAGALFFAPAVVPYIALAFAFQLLLRGDLGLLNYWLKVVGLKNPPNWLADPNIIVWVIPILTIYAFYTGQMMVIFDAALKQVPKELYEVAQLDGAGPLTVFFRVTLPMISPIILFNLIVGFINILNMSFTFIYPLTGGGPGKASTVLSIDIYENAFKNFQVGYACAQAMILFLLSAIVTFFMFQLSKRMVYYET